MDMNRKLMMVIAVVSGLFILLSMSFGCGVSSSSNDAPAKINLMIDDDKDGLPDQLVEAVNDALNVAQESGDPDSIDSPEEEAAFQDAMAGLLEKMPYSDETLRLQLEINDLYKQVADPAVDTERSDALLDQIEQDLDEMRRDDMSYNIVQDAASTMLDNPEETPPSGEANDMAGRPDYDSMQKGDILFGRSTSGTVHLPYVIDFTHAGNYQGNSFVYEAVTDGVIIRPLSVWKTDYGRVALGRSNRKTSSEISSAFDWAIIRYGTASMSGYNFSVFMPHDKRTEDICLKPPYQRRCLYCSQLTWKIHDHAGVNVDSNNAKYIALAALKYLGYGGILSAASVSYLMGIIIPGVMPDEIYRDKSITVYSDGNNLAVTPINPPTNVNRVYLKMGKIAIDSEFYNPSAENHLYVNGASAPKGEALDYYAALYYYDKNNQRHVGIEGKWYPTALISFPSKPEWLDNSVSFEVTVKARLKRDYASISSEYTRKFPRMM
jgi:uncharacterized protein YycO